MQVQDFTVIRISPIVYNDRDILEIGVISHGPQTGHANTHARTHTHKKVLQQQQVMQTCFIQTQQRHSEQRESVGTHHGAHMMQSGCAIQHGIFKNHNRLQHRFAVLLFTGSVCLISHTASHNGMTFSGGDCIFSFIYLI